jgi:hypothetical protein
MRVRLAELRLDVTAPTALSALTATIFAIQAELEYGWSDAGIEMGLFAKRMDSFAFRFCGIVIQFRGLNAAIP